ncbi:unnamed protein product, partial [Enterobius vermicularis]|uniref:KASH domain-containing protein n=1 Tax=Enterobius vermicularis TaxID=51028 RepID=A0A0N4UTN3_ENTVE
EEGKNLRDYIGDWLKRLKDFQQRLKDSVGNKLAAIAEFVALQTDVRNQLDSLKSTPVPDVFNLSVMSCNERLEELERMAEICDKLKNRMVSANTAELDAEKNVEKDNLLRELEMMEDNLKSEKDTLKKRLSHLLEQEKLAQQAKRLITDIETFVDKGNKLLLDEDANPNFYDRVANESKEVLDAADELFQSRSVEDEDLVEKLKTLLINGQDIKEKLSGRYNLWNKFVSERDLAMENLEHIRGLIDVTKSLRSAEEVLSDLESLKAANEVFEKLKDHMKILGSLCDQLSPLATTYADVRFFDVDVEQTQEEYENLMSEMNRELNDEKAFCEQQEQLTAEFGRIESEQLASRDKDQIIEIISYQLPALEAAVKQFCNDIENSARTRNYVESVVTPSALRSRFEELKKKADELLLEIEQEEELSRVAELQEKLEQISLKSAPNEEELLKLEEQIQQIPVEREDVKLLADQLQSIRARKQEQEAVEKEMSEELNQVTEDMKNIEQNLTAILSRERFEDGDLKELAKLKDEVENNLLKKTDEIASKIAESNVVLNNLEPEIQREHDFVEKVKALIADKTEQVEYKEGVRKALKELENELVESDNLSATAQNIRLSKDVDRVKELLRRLKELQSSLAQYIDRLSAVKGGDFDENEMGMIIEKIREAEATAEGMKALDEALSAQIEAVNHWNADKERLRNETEPVIEAIHTLVDEYANR